MLKSRLALAAAVTGMSLIACWTGGVAQAQQVCDSASLAGAEACFYSGRFLTGREFDLGIPLAQQLPMPTNGGCTDLPSGFGTDGSVTNTSSDTLYVFTTNCPDTQPAMQPAAVVVSHYSGSVLAGTGPAGHAAIRSVRLCGPGLAIDPIALTCAYLR